MPGVETVHTSVEPARPCEDRQHNGKTHLNKQGGSRSSALHKEAVVLFQWAECHMLSLRAEHKRGLDNVQLDWISQQSITPGEWSLKRDLFQDIVLYFGRPDIDLFTSHLNCQVSQFFSHYLHPRAEVMDALMSPWPQGLLYVFPPIPLFPWVFSCLREQRSVLILVAPWWPYRPWFSMIQ